MGTHMLMVPMLMELTHTPMVTMERDPLRLNQRLMLMLTTDTHMATDHTDTEPTDMDTHTDTMERDLLMLSQRLRLMLTTDTHTDTDHMDAEPEAKADAALLYGAYGYGAYPYAGVYGGYRSYGYPYAYGAYRPYAYGAYGRVWG